MAPLEYWRRYENWRRFEKRKTVYPRKKTKLFAQVAIKLAICEQKAVFGGNARLRGALTRILSPKQGGCRPPPKGVPPCSTI